VTSVAWPADCGAWHNAGDYDTHDTPRQPVKQFRGGASYDTSGEYVRHPHHATSEGAVVIPPPPPGARLSFQSESGQQILGRNAGLHDRVITHLGETTIGAALHTGEIVELPGGGYGYPDAPLLPPAAEAIVARTRRSNSRMPLSPIATSFPRHRKPSTSKSPKPQVTCPSLTA
jgi:hypothetical protein